MAIQVRVRSFADIAKGAKVLVDVMSAFPERQMLVALDKDELLQIVGTGMKGTELAEFLALAVQALEVAAGQMKEVRLRQNAGPFIKPPDSTGQPRKRLIREGADGQLLPPPGQHFMVCGECGHSAWFVTMTETSDPSLSCCMNCGNEVANHLIRGHA
jgi:hypothetical protein